MVNDIRIHLAIIMYMGGCLSLMIYNAIVIFHKKNTDKAMQKNKNKWIIVIFREFHASSSMTTLSQKHKNRLARSLKHVEKLIAFSNALNFFKLKHGTDFYEKYMAMLMQCGVFHRLAVAYKRKKNEERAYFAYFVSQHPQIAKTTKGICTNTIDTMVSYIEASDIYCRVNVLKALCMVGDLHGITSVLQFFSDKDNFIHHKLLAEDLFNFTGDKDVLAQHLWGKYKEWNDNIRLGVITFISMFSSKFEARM